MTQRASFERVLTFCNEIREAGGANPLDALMPAIPTDSTACLIARNLNFSCYVSTSEDHDNPHYWFMAIDDDDVVDKIVENINEVDYFVNKEGVQYENRIGLPSDIAQVAIEFDKWELGADYAEADPNFLQYVNESYKATLVEEGIIDEDDELTY